MKAGLGPFAVSTSDQFSAIGDAHEEFRRETLENCESIAKSYQAHFDQKGFPVSLPKQRLNLVVLSGPKSYAKFVGDDLGPAIGGHYDQDENYLVTFDFTEPGRPPTVAAAHRTHGLSPTKQLTFSPSTRACSTARRTSRAASARAWRPMARPGDGRIGVSTARSTANG